MADTRTEEQKLKSKRTHALVMMILGAIMSVCALAAGLIAISPGVFPSWMTGGWGSRPAPAHREPKAALVAFVEFGPEALLRARKENKLVLLHLAPSWSREAKLMEETVYADPKAAAWISDNLVAARADADERPDLVQQYGVGAWPTTALVHPDGRPLAGASRLTTKLFLPWAKLIAATLKADPLKAEGFAADARRRVEAVRRRAEPAAGPDDPVWGGAHRSASEFAKTLDDQAAVVRSTDAARAKAALGFVSAFMALPGGGYAASVMGEVELPDGRIEEGASYFAKDDAGRRASGLPFVDRRLFSGSNAGMAQAVLMSRAATPAHKAHARRTLDFLWTRFVRDGRVLRTPGGLVDWPSDRQAIIEAELAAGRPARAAALRKPFARK